MCKNIVDLKKEIDKLKMVELLAPFMQDLRESILDSRFFMISCNKKSVDNGVGLIADFDSVVSTENSTVATVATKFLTILLL